MPRRLESWHFAYGAFGLLVPGLAGIVLPLLVVQAGHRPFRIGAVVAAQNWGVLTASVWGWYADRSRHYLRTLAGGLLLSCLGLAVFVLVTRLTPLLLAAGVIGVGAGACSTAAPLLVTRYNPEIEWSSSLARMQACGALGTIFGLLLASRLRPGIAIACSCALAFLALVLMTRGKTPRSLAQHGHSLSETTAITRRSRPLQWFVLFLLIWSLFSVAVSAFSALYPVAMLHGFGIGVSQSSDAMVLGTLASLPLYALSGRLIRRFGCSRILLFGILLRMLALSGIAILTVLHQRADAPVLLLAALFQGAWPLVGVSASELAALLAPGQVGLALGFFNAAGAVASGLGAILGGSVAELSGYRSISLYAAAVAFAAAAFSVPLIRHVQQRSGRSREC